MADKMTELCRGLASNAMMISVYTDEIRNDNTLNIGYIRDDEMRMNKNLTTMVRILELWLEDS